MARSARQTRTHEARIPARAIASAAAMSVTDVFRRITGALDLAGIAYMLSGSFAAASYGSPRSTQDIDLVIAATPSKLQAFVQGLSSNEYYVDLDTALEAFQRESLLSAVG